MSGKYAAFTRGPPSATTRASTTSTATSQSQRRPRRFCWVVIGMAGGQAEGQRTNAVPSRRISTRGFRRRRAAGAEGGELVGEEAGGEPVMGEAVVAGADGRRVDERFHLGAFGVGREG